ncbi:MAG TPA: AsmA-like C-terminal region-containing protein, partial [Burkholderiales bacterium]
REAEARAQAEEKRRTKAEAELRAKLEMDARAKAEAEAQARAEAEARAKAEAESRAKQETAAMEVAEEELRREAEATFKDRGGGGADLASLALAIEQAAAEFTDQVEAKAVQETQAKARVENQARAAVEAKAAAVAADAAAAAVEAAVLNMARQDELERRAAEEKARLAAEEQVRNETEERRRLEDKAREAMRKREEEELARLEREREAAERARQEAELKSKAEEEKRKWAEAAVRTKQVEEMRARLEADAKAREAEATARAEAKAREQEKAAARKKRGLPKGLIALVLLAVLIAGPIAYIQYSPLPFLVSRAERALSERIQEPATVGAVRLALMPATRLTLQGVTLGKAREVRIESLETDLSLQAMLFGVKALDEVELRGVTITQEVLTRLPAWATGGPLSIPVARVAMKDATLQLRNGPLLRFDGEASLVAGEGLKEARIASRDGKLSMVIKPRGKEFEVALSARAWQLPSIPAVAFDELRAVGVTTRQELQLTDVEGKLYGGAFKAAARLRLLERPGIEGTFRLKEAQAEPLAQALLGAALKDGSVDASGSFVAQGPDAEKSFQALRLEAGFTVRNGSLGGVDLAGAAATGNRNPVQGGSTAFSELAGALSLSGERYQLKQLRLAAEGLSASGSAEVGAGHALAGRLAVEPRSAGLARTALALSGTAGEPVLAPAK